jgi:hypothetical protein
MTQNQKIWALRLASVPAVLSFPFICFGLAVTITRENRGDSAPVISMLSLFVGLLVAIKLSLLTVFARIDSSPKRCFNVLVIIAGFDVIGFILAKWFMSLYPPN